MKHRLWREGLNAEELLRGLPTWAHGYRAVLAAKAPSLEEVLNKAADQGIPFVILDGTLVSSDRCPGKKTSRVRHEVAHMSEHEDWRADP